MSNNAPELTRSNNGDEHNKEQKVIVLSIKDMVKEIHLNLRIFHNFYIL